VDPSTGPRGCSPIAESTCSPAGWAWSACCRTATERHGSARCGSGGWRCRHVSFAVPRHPCDSSTHIGDTESVRLLGAMYALPNRRAPPAYPPAAAIPYGINTRP
jgi:hypothetical protein